MTLLRLIIMFLFLDVFHLLFGLLLVRFNCTHRIGLRWLAMSCFFPDKKLPGLCRLDCQSVQCGNWTCSDYHRYPNKKNKRRKAASDREIQE